MKGDFEYKIIISAINSKGNWPLQKWTTTTTFYEYLSVQGCWLRSRNFDRETFSWWTRGPPRSHRSPVLLRPPDISASLGRKYLHACTTCTLHNPRELCTLWASLWRKRRKYTHCSFKFESFENKNWFDAHKETSVSVIRRIWSGRRSGALKTSGSIRNFNPEEF